MSSFMYIYIFITRHHDPFMTITNNLTTSGTLTTYNASHGQNFPPTISFGYYIDRLGYGATWGTTFFLCIFKSSNPFVNPAAVVYIYCCIYYLNFIFLSLLYL